MDAIDDTRRVSRSPSMLIPSQDALAAPISVPRFISREGCRAIIAQLHEMGLPKGQRIDLVSQWRGEVRWGRNRISSAGDWRTNQIVLGAWSSRSPITLNQVDSQSLRAGANRLREIEALLEVPGELLIPYAKADAVYPQTHIWSDATYAQQPEERTTLVAHTTTTVEQAGMFTAGYLSVEALGTAYWLKNGVFLYAPQTVAQCSLTVRDPNGVGSGWAGASSYDWTQIDVPKLTAIALEKCLTSRNPVRVEPGRYVTILEPQATFELLRQVIAGSPYDDGYITREANETGLPDRSHIPFTSAPAVIRYPSTDAFSDGAQYGKTRLGQQLFDQRIQIRSDPLDPQLGTLPFSYWEGDPFVPVTWFENGVLKTLATGSTYAVRTLRMAPQPWSGAFRMEGNTPPVTVEEMIATTKRGLLVTRFWDVRIIDVESVQCTGLTRDGLWLIENGKIVHPVKNFRFTESPMFAFNNVEQIGTPVPIFNPTCPAVVPPVKVRDFNFTSLIDAI